MDSVGNALKGRSTRYWDCCKVTQLKYINKMWCSYDNVFHPKPSCSWSGKASVTKPVSSCSQDGYSVLFDSNVPSGCGGGGKTGFCFFTKFIYVHHLFFEGAFTCNNNQPWAINNDLSYGFAAARMAGKTEADLCCKCFEWTFTSGPVIGKKMVIQVTNTGEDLNQSVRVH